MTGFHLDDRLAADTVAVAELSLCSVRLMDDCRWPWLILVPRRPGLRELFDLHPSDQPLMIAEVAHAARILSDRGGHKINVAALGNIVAQLHVHVIARDPGDPAWPGPVWGVGARERYRPDALAALAGTLGTALARLPSFGAV